MRTENRTAKITSSFDPVYSHIDYCPRTGDILTFWVSTPQKFRDTEVDKLLQAISEQTTSMLREIQGVEE